MDLNVLEPFAGERSTVIRFDGFDLPSTFRMEFRLAEPTPGQKADPPTSFIVLARGSIEVSVRDGRPRCDRLILDHGEYPITGSTLRSLPIHKLLRVAVAKATRYDEAGWVDWVSDMATAPQPSWRAGRRLNPNIAAAARIYREALAVEKKPGPMIAEELHVTHASARRLVQQARAAGLLGGSLGQGRVGEQVLPGRGVSRTE